MDGLGNINWWGFSPSIDLQKYYYENSKLSSHASTQVSDEVLNILIIGAGDQRHILETIASRKKYPAKKIRFFVYEKMLELYARDFLLLSLAVEQPAKRGIQEKTELFLEIFGNLLIRDYTSQILQSKANEFIKCITDFDYMPKINLTLFDFTLLKYKERDFLEGIFKYWRLKDTKVQEHFPASKCWEIRLRNYYATRYDVRANAYDWDFAMKLAERTNASIIHKKLFSQWRETGVAFELRDSCYDTPNKTLASSMVFNDPRSGDKTGRRGYFGDIIIGPFLSYGIKSDNLDFFKKQNDQYRYTSLDVARSNVSSLMNSILESSGLDLKKYKSVENVVKNVSGLKIEEIIEEEEEEVEKKTEGTINTDQTKSENEIEQDYFTLNDCQITFLPLTALQDFVQKPKYDKFFDIVYFSNTTVTHFNKSMSKIYKPNALVLLETAKYMIEMSKQQIHSFSTRVKELANESDLLNVNSSLNNNDKKSSKSGSSDLNNLSEEQENVVLDQTDLFCFRAKST
jgi:dynein assembly factor 3, axonemal